jgi:hypothetical protein
MDDLGVEFTADHDRHSVCWQHHEFSVKALEGTLPAEAADSWFAYDRDRTFADEIVQNLQEDGGHPVLRWNASNVAVRQDPDKERSSYARSLPWPFRCR